MKVCCGMTLTETVEDSKNIRREKLQAPLYREKPELIHHRLPHVLLSINFFLLQNNQGNIPAQSFAVMKYSVPVQLFIRENAADLS